MLVPLAGADPQPAVVADAATLPVCRTARPPERGYYPAQARSRGKLGRVRLEYSVSSQGLPVNVKVLDSPSRALNSGALALLSDMVCAFPDGRSLEGVRRITVDVVFALGDSPVPAAAVPVDWEAEIRASKPR